MRPHFNELPLRLRLRFVIQAVSTRIGTLIGPCRC
jgi:hypothetical protein